MLYSDLLGLCYRNSLACPLIMSAYSSSQTPLSYALAALDGSSSFQGDETNLQSSPCVYRWQCSDHKRKRGQQCQTKLLYNRQINHSQLRSRYHSSGHQHELDRARIFPGDETWCQLVRATERGPGCWTRLTSLPLQTAHTLLLPLVAHSSASESLRQLLE